MKVLNIILRVVLALLLVSPILGAFGVFPEPTPEMYNTPEAYAYIKMLLEVGYVTFTMTVVFIAILVLIAMNRMALAALLLLPITVNIVGFHAVLDGGLFTKGAIMGNLLLLLNLYFLWQNRAAYKPLFAKSAN